MNHRHLRVRIRWILMAWALLLPCGCIMLPIPTGEHKVLRGKPVKPEHTAFLTPGVTTKQQVTQRLGSPDIIWNEANLFAYHWVMRSGILLWAVGGGYSGVGGVADIENQHVLLIEFDSRQRVRRFESVERSPLQPYGEFLKTWVKSGTTR